MLGEHMLKKSDLGRKTACSGIRSLGFCKLENLPGNQKFFFDIFMKSFRVCVNIQVDFFCKYKNSPSRFQQCCRKKNPSISSLKIWHLLPFPQDSTSKTRKSSRRKCQKQSISLIDWMQTIDRLPKGTNKFSDTRVLWGT